MSHLLQQLQQPATPLISQADIKITPDTQGTVLSGIRTAWSYPHGFGDMPVQYRELASTRTANLHHLRSGLKEESRGSCRLESNQPDPTAVGRG